MIESTSGSASRPAPRGASTVARIGPAGPGIETCSQATPVSARCQAAPSRVSRRRRAGLLEVEIDDAGARRAQRDDAPAPRRVAVHVRPAAGHLGRARPPAESARAHCARPASAGRSRRPHRPRSAHRSASTSQSTRSLEPVDDAGADGGRARGRAGCPRPPARPRASPRSRTARRPRRCRGRRRARRRATRTTRCTSPRAAPARAGSPPRAGTTCTAGGRSRSARSPRSAQNAMRLPSGDQAKLSTDQSPRVRRRARAPARAVLHEEVRVPVEVAVCRRGASRRA